MAVRLVLWDIDLTLINARGMGRVVYERVFPGVTGQPMREVAMLFGGRTELETIRDTLELHGLPATDELVDGLLAALAEGFEAARAELTARGVVLPGALEALVALADRPGLWQSVLTGNTRAVAAIKLEAFGLDPYLDLSLGAFGDDHADRAALVDIALERARHRLGEVIAPRDVLLVGDTVNDVTAAQVSGARLVAVTTGRYSEADLRAAGAETILASLTELPALLPALIEDDPVPTG
ncbi:HAD family hydrolase [Pseudofrankia inefficax]|uniref:Haloacid dehalogenase domain protein hydrolase n=1 Tax=Pseudofrankia inefficax (strain DSM 45817 / CECT 9037 / DDB 130130 / EuI1c) TaxID=298654 RepID=E3J2M5_PSEI1|nr:haloacid dehalogenase-like hydrolase [Pseudofrankia inefficax]ADP80539.1 Haloacid dehalogenase domain protein hydrolase [Pseudofrankia inefficax]